MYTFEVEMDSNKIEKCPIDGFHIAYHRMGTGEPVLFLHGITTYSFIWNKVAPILSKNYELIIPDLVGCGFSDKPTDIEYSLINHAEFVKQFIEQLGFSKVHFVGHDVGGGIGQIFAVRYPEKILKLVLVNTVGYDFWPVQPIVAMRTPIIRHLAMASLDLGTFKLVLRRAFYNKEYLTPELFDKFWEQMKTKEGRRAFLHFAKCLNNQHLLEISDKLKQLPIPVMIIRGVADVYLDAKISEKLNSEIPGSQLIRFDKAGHFLQQDEPDRLAKTLQEFFEG